MAHRISRPKTIVLIVALLVWTILWNFHWQGWLETLPWLRLFLALTLFVLPGIWFQHLLTEDKPRPLSYQLTDGLAASLALTGILGGIARALQASFAWVAAGLYLAGACSLTAVFLSGRRRSERRRSSGDFWQRATFGLMLLLVLAAVVMTARLAVPPLLNGDDFTYNAHLNYFQNAPTYTFEFDEALSRLEISRFWLAFWPLVEAVIAYLSGMHGLLLTGVYLAPALVVLSAISVYSLGLALGLRPPAALLAVGAQLVSLVRLTLPNQAGEVFFDRLPEDKAAAAFVVAPLVLRLVCQYLDQPTRRRLALLGVGVLALAFTHPVILGMTCLLAGAYALIEVGFSRRGRALVQLLLVLGAVMLIPVSLRFGEGEQLYTFSVEETVEAGRESKFNTQRLRVLTDDRFYGISPQVTRGFPYELMLMAGGVGLIHLKRSKAGRFVLASLGILGLAVFPYTGWILGLAVTPFQLWRLTWLMPFGLAVAFFVQAVVDFLVDRLPRFGKWNIYARGMAMLAVQLAVLAGGVYIWGWAQGNLGVGGVKPGFERWYVDYIAVGEQLRQLQPQQAVIVGGPDRATNDLIPSLSLDVRLVSFRNERGGRQAQLWQLLIGEDTPPNERLALLTENRVRFLLLRGDVPWMDALWQANPERFALVGGKGKLKLYQLTPTPFPPRGGGARGEVNQPIGERRAVRHVAPQRIELIRPQRGTELHDQAGHSLGIWACAHFFQRIQCL